jgi:glycosyltransferase involved in cell wall biosynthesis
VTGLGAAIWVGVLDLDDSTTVAALSGAVRAEHGQARILIRMHGAPLGYVTVPVRPEQTLTERTAAAAQTVLAVPLREHARENDAGLDSGDADWAALVACPRRFAPDHAGISVIICSRDRAAGLARCLGTVQRCSYQPLEILVVDNAPSSDETRQVVAALGCDDPRIRYTREPRPGLSRARNHGLALARFPIAAFTDDDTMVDPGWPAALAAGFAADPQTVCVTGLVASAALDTGSERYFDSRYAWGEAFEPKRFDLGAHRDASRLYPFSAGIFGTGANFAVRRGAVAAAGGFDPLLGAGSPGRGGDDLDIFVRLILAGGRLSYVPSALVWHRHRADTVALGEQIYSYGYGLGAYLAKHLLDRQLPPSLIARGLGRAGQVLGRMQRAGAAGQLGAHGGGMAVREICGTLAGALRYYRARLTAADA